jgi:hypothetical protein
LSSSTLKGLPALTHYQGNQTQQPAENSAVEELASPPAPDWAAELRELRREAGALLDLSDPTVPQAKFKTPAPAPILIE